MDTSSLEGLGLTKSEIKLYITLLELGSTKVGPAIEKSALASSAVHNALNSLIEKGLIGFIKKGKIKYYHAVSPKQLVDYIEEKKKRVMEILPELESKAKPLEEQEAEVFEGKKGVIAMLNILIEDSKPGDDYLFFNIDIQEMNNDLMEFFNQYHTKRYDKGLNSKGLALKNTTRPVPPRKGLHMKYVSTPIPNGATIFKNKICFYAWGEKPVGYLIKSKQIADSYKKLFYEIWERGKQVK